MKRPYIICHMMASLDGRIDCTMTSKLPGVSEYYNTLQQLNVPTTLSGKVTAKMELTDSDDFVPENDTPVGKESFFKALDAEAYSLVVDTKGTLKWGSSVVSGSPLVMIMSERASNDYLEYLKAQNISFITCGKNKIDLQRAAEILYCEFHVERMGIVGGGTINAGFLDAGLLDEVSMLYGPAIDGRGGMKATFDGLSLDREPFLLELQSVQTYDSGAVWMRYRVK